MSVPAIQVERLGKRYRVSHGVQRNTYKTLRESLIGLATAPFRTRATVEDFWALQDISFNVRTGEVIGIIGRNGAGKSTLLKIMSRITKPTSGKMKINGRIGSLLEVGTGFHPELTGRENVYLNGSILGMSRKEIDRKFDEIVAFAEVEKFLDTPVKRYSSGMYVRLAFAVAAHLEPEILIIDEVLAVGDQEFQQKCLGRMRTVANTGRTVLFVSHNMPIVRTICSRCILLANGKVECEGPAASVVDRYFTTQSSDTFVFGRMVDVADYPRWGGSGEARFSQITMFKPDDLQAIDKCFSGGDIGFRIRLDGDLSVVKALGIQLTDDNDRKLINLNSLEKQMELHLDGRKEITFVVRQVNLRPGRFKLGFWAGASETRHIDVITEQCILEVVPPENNKWISRYDGIFRCEFDILV